jgi:hypothetical protein
MGQSVHLSLHSETSEEDGLHSETSEEDGLHSETSEEDGLHSETSEDTSSTTHQYNCYETRVSTEAKTYTQKLTVVFR